MSKKEKKELEQAIAAAESEHLRRSRRKMSVRDFVNVKLIGRGAFGEVQIASCSFASCSFLSPPSTPPLSQPNPPLPLLPPPQVRVVAERNEKGEPTERVYAMKIMNKDFMIQKNQVRLSPPSSFLPPHLPQLAHARAERDAMVEHDYDGIVKLYWAFQDERFLYFVMEYLPGTPSTSFPSLPFLLLFQVEI